MKDDCVSAVEEALGRSLRAGESQKIEDSIALHTRLLARDNPEEWANLSPYDRLQQAAQASAKAMTAEVKLKQERVKLQIQAHDRIEQSLNDAFDKLPQNAKPGSMMRVVSQMLAFDTKGKGLTSVETWGNAIRQETFSQLIPLWSSVKGFAGVFENPKGMTDLVRELHGEDSGNTAAKAGADAWKKITDGLRERANAAGMDIGKLDDWHYPQSHSQGRIAKAGLEKWTEDTLPKLNRSKYINDDGSRMSDDRVRDFLRYAYDSIITDGFNKVKPGEGRPGAGLTANRQSAHRQIFFKDADSYLSYQGDYGDKSLWATLTGHVSTISRDIALNEVLGPNAEQTFRYFNDRTKLDELRSAPESIDKINSAAHFNESLYDTVAGKTQVVNQKVADFGQSFRNWEVATKLGKVVITALGDEAGMSATAYANKIPWSEVFAREFKYLNPANSEDRSIATHAGLGINGMIQGLNRFGSEDLNLANGVGAMGKIREFTSKLATTVMHASGAEAMWDTRRRALGSVLMSYLGKTVGEVEHFSDLNPTDHGMLANKGVTENDWLVWKAAKPEDWGMKHGVLTPKAIYAIPDEVVAKALGRSIGPPPAASGMVRMYHGGSPEGVQGPLWFTSDLGNAKGWASRGQGMNVWYTDVPESKLVEHTGDTVGQYKTIKEAREAGFAPLSNIELPADLANQRQLLNASTGADARAVAQAKRNAVTMLLGHVLEETGMGVMDTGARERATLRTGTTSGTLGGELWRSVLLFKGFSASMMMKHWSRASDMPTAAAKAQYAARLIVTGTIMGAAANQIRNLIGGKDPQNVAEPRFWAEATLRGGGLGFYGDFLYSEATSHDTTLIPALMGPLATEAESAWNLTGGAAFKAARGERTDEGANLIRYTKGNLPFLNMWYTQAAMDHLIWNEMQEAASPGYLDRMQAKAEATRGTSWYWDPHDKAPSQAPDFSKVWQPERGAEQLSKIADTASKAAEAVGVE